MNHEIDAANYYAQTKQYKNFIIAKIEHEKTDKQRIIEYKYEELKIFHFVHETFFFVIILWKQILIQQNKPTAN